MKLDTRYVMIRDRVIRPFQGMQLRAVGLLVAIIVLAILFQILNPAFLSTTNVLFLVRAMSALAIIAFAQMFLIVQGELDLSVGSVYLLSTTTFAVLWLGGGGLPFSTPMLVAFVCAMLVGGLAGWINGYLTTVVRIPSFIATLGMMSVAQGFALMLSEANSFSPAYNSPAVPAGELAVFQALGGTILPGGIPIQVLWLAVAFVIFWILRHKTLYGFRSVAIGGNEPAAEVARLPVNRYKRIAFVLVALMASVAGILDFSYTGSVGPSAGGSLMFPVFAAVIIGGSALTGGRGTVFGTLLGALLLAVLNNGLALLGVGTFVQLVVVGLVTILAVTLDQVGSRFGRRGKKLGPAPAGASA